jgi:hypothetical protein
VIAMLVRKIRAGLDVLVAAAAVRQARNALKSTAIGSYVDTSGSAATVSPIADGPTRLTTTEQAVAWRWGAAVDRALRWTPGDAACLVRSNALRSLVLSRGLPRATVRIGVRRSGTQFEAHAWVEQDGTSIAEPVGWRGAFAALDGVTTR